jgi:hypothetical protein
MMPSRDSSRRRGAALGSLVALLVVLAAVPAHATPAEPSFASRPALQLIQSLTGWLAGLWERQEITIVPPAPPEPAAGTPTTTGDEGASLDPDG